MTPGLATPGVTAQTLSKLLCMAVSLVCTISVAADNRQAYNGQTHQWLSAIGKLEVPGQRHRGGRHSHYVEDCSATLVGKPGRQSANTIITAWHCLEFYADLSKPISFTLLADSGTPILRQAYRLANGGGMEADWAILRLHRGVPATRVRSLEVGTQRANPQRTIIMAGYSRDEGGGANGQRLSFDPACSITRQHANSSDTNCTAHKGASGGAAVQLSNTGEPLLYGVISQGDGAGFSTYIPTEGFLSAIVRHLK